MPIIEEPLKMKRESGSFRFIEKSARQFQRNWRRRVRLPRTLKNKKCKKKLPGNPESFKIERMKGVEPSSSAWKAEIISRYMTSAKMFIIYKSHKKMSIPFKTIFFSCQFLFLCRRVPCLCTFRNRQCVQDGRW